MHVELLDKLRCLNAHEDSHLVVTTAVTVRRHIREGLLGCPVCKAEYPIHEGVVDYGFNDLPLLELSQEFFSEERVTKLAAMLALDERGGLYILDCVSSLLTSGIAKYSPDSQFIVLSAHQAISGAGAILRSETLPLAPGCARGIVLDRSSASLLRSAILALAPGGRLVAPVETNKPAGITILARDDEYWVGERELSPVISELRRAPR